jgi:hypothetical protein
MITHVAIKYKGFVYSLPRPNRHHHVIRMIAEINGVGIKGPDVQGFLDDKGNFLNRQEAYIHAKECVQVIRKVTPGNYDGDSLFSEDLW